jgi:hypothetical protein
MVNVDYWDGRASRQVKPIPFLLRHKHDVNGFEIGPADDGHYYMMVNLYAYVDGEQVQYARLHMMWADLSIMLAFMHRRSWRGVPYYWQNGHKRTIGKRVPSVNAFV